MDTQGGVYHTRAHKSQLCINPQPGGVRGRWRAHKKKEAQRRRGPAQGAAHACEGAQWVARRNRKTRRAHRRGCETRLRRERHTC